MIIYKAKIVDIEHTPEADIGDPNGTKIVITMQWNTACVGDTILVALFDVDLCCQ